MNDICDEGALCLIQAIVRQAKNDFMHSAPSSEVRKDAERFFQSKWFEVLTSLNGDVALRDLQAEYDRKHKKKGMKKHGFE